MSIAHCVKRRLLQDAFGPGFGADKCWIDAFTVIAYFYQYVFSCCFIGTGNNITISFAIFETILYQVDQHLSYFFFISKNCNRRFTTFFNAAGDVFFYGFNGKRIEYFTD